MSEQATETNTTTTEQVQTNDTQTDNVDPSRPAEETAEAAQDAAKVDAQTSVDGASTAKDAPANGSPAKDDSKPGALSDIDARLAKIEAAIAAEREAKAAAKKQPEAKPEEAKKDEPTKEEIRAAIELVKEGRSKRADAALRFLEENGIDVDDDLLLELAPKLEGKVKRELTDEEKFEAFLAKRDAKAKAEAEAKAAKEAEERKAAEAKQAEEDQKELESYLKRAAAKAKEGITAGKYPFLEAYGIDTNRLTKLLFERVAKDKAIPDPDLPLSDLEKELESHWMKGPKSKLPQLATPASSSKEETIDDVDERIRRSFEEHRSEEYTPMFSEDGDDDPARKLLLEIDRDKSVRRDWRA